MKPTMTGNVIVFLFSSFALSMAQMNFVVDVMSGTSRSSCDFGPNDEAVWGVKAYTQTEYTLFNGEGYGRCNSDGPSPNQPVTIMDETINCLDQPQFFSLCLMAGDDSSNDCLFPDLECVVEDCIEVEMRKCFNENCFVDFFEQFDVSNNRVNTEDVEIRIIRSGDCTTTAPTKAPSTTPTQAPVRPTTTPTKAPTRLDVPFPCAGTLQTCGGGSNYEGPECCIVGHACEENVCRIIQANSSNGAFDASTLIGALVFFGIVFVIGLTFHKYFGKRPEKAAEEGAVEPSLDVENVRHYTQNDHEPPSRDTPKSIVLDGERWEKTSDLK